eukprot:867312_1
MSKLYADAAGVVRKVSGGRGGIKSLVYGASDQTVGSTYALASETLKYRSILEELLDKAEVSKLLKNKKTHFLQLVVAYDLLFGSGQISGGGAVKKAVMKRKSVLVSALARLKIKRGVSDNKDLLPEELRVIDKLPRFARVNSLKASLKEVLSEMKADGWILGEGKWEANSPKSPFDSESRTYYLDGIVPNLLVFPPGTDFHDHSAVKEGRLVLQDKASCLPAIALGPKPDWHVIDACAAPGNKTSHLAALLGSTGRVDAFERNARRCEFLRTRMQSLGTNERVRVHNQDFLKSSPNDKQWKTVKAILLDPSCSGSGLIHQRFDHFANKEAKSGADLSEELSRLSNFQVALVDHAMKFPNVQRIVYSTCSIHKEENELVVGEILDMHPEYELENAIPKWHRRGIPCDSVNNPDLLVRCSTVEDLTNGFFVARFRRIPGAKPRATKLKPRPKPAAVVAVPRPSQPSNPSSDSRKRSRAQNKQLSKRARKKRKRADAAQKEASNPEEHSEFNGKKKRKLTKLEKRKKKKKQKLSKKWREH